MTIGFAALIIINLSNLPLDGFYQGFTVEHAAGGYFVKFTSNPSPVVLISIKFSRIDGSARVTVGGKPYVLKYVNLNPYTSPRDAWFWSAGYTARFEGDEWIDFSDGDIADINGIYDLQILRGGINDLNHTRQWYLYIRMAETTWIHRFENPDTTELYNPSGIYTNPHGSPWGAVVIDDYIPPQ